MLSHDFGFVNFSDVLILNKIFKNQFSYQYEVFKVQSDDFSSSGDGEIRTLDPLLARQVLSQLSYAPRLSHLKCDDYLIITNHDRLVMGLRRLELPTSRLSGVRSNQLSYKPRTWRPPAFPCRLQHSIIGRFRLNHRVRDV